MPAAPTIAEAVAALKAFAEALPQRPGLLVAPPVIGGPAPAEAIARLRANPRLLPPALIDLYELMDGCEIMWKFRDPARPDEELSWGYENGRFRIPPLSADVRLQDDLNNEYSFFGPNALSVCFEQTEPEYGTWLAAYGPGGPMPEDEREDYHPEDYLDEQDDDTFDDAFQASEQADVANARLAFQVYKNEYLPLPGTVAEYLMQAIAHGCVLQWPLAWQSESPDMDRLGAEWEGSVSQKVQRFRDVTGL